MRRTRQLLLIGLTILPVGVYAACGDDDDGVVAQNPGGTDASTDHSSSTKNDSGKSGDDDDDKNPTDGGVVRGPISMDFDTAGNGDPTSLAWDDATQTLYIADNKNNDVWTWTDSTNTFHKLVKLPNTSDAAAPFPTDVGQIVILSDGTIVVPRFGGGTNGGISFINPSVASKQGEVPGVSATLKRVALAAAPDDTMYGSTFIKASGDDAGVVTKVTLTGETPYAGGFQKVVATLVQDQALYVTDQSRGLIYILPLDGGAQTPYDVFATVPAPDTTIQGPNNTLITGQFQVLEDGGGLHVRQVDSSGTVTTIANDLPLTKPKGLAYDKTNRRLFVADSNGSAVRTIKIFPLE